MLQRSRSESPSCYFLPIPGMGMSFENNTRLLWLCLLPYLIGPENSRPFCQPIRFKTKTYGGLARSHAFSRTSSILLVFTLRSH